MTLTATDLFCGAGGSSLGAELAGIELVMAANHWTKAIDVHQANFPEARHDCADISAADPRRYPRTDLLLASPECTNHSSSKGVSRKRQDPNLFDSADIGAERSRATMWDVHRFVEEHNYDAVIVENVVDAVRWRYWPSWWQAWDDAGYDARVLSINSAHTGEVSQWRDRIYVVAVRRGLPAPDLEFHPPCWCSTCEKVVDGVQSFKRPETRAGKWRQQYHYRCPECGKVAAPPAPPASAVIDWTLPAGRIGDRKRPLAEATLRRIRLGMERYGTALVAGRGNTWERPGTDYARAWPVDQPAPTQAATLQHGVAGPPAFLMQPHHSGDDGCRVRSIDEPAWTASASRDMPALVVPLRRNGHAHPDDRPTAAMCAGGGHHALLMAPQSDGRAMPVDRPVPSLTAKIPPMLIPYQRAAIGQPVTDPVPTVTTRDRAAVVEPAIDIDDCLFRMFEPHEVKAAMAFPGSYQEGDGLTKGDRVRLWGNAVTPPVSTLLTRRVVAALEGSS